jgi:hypothetical protein
MVQSLDDNVGKMLDALDRLELADSTIILFFSDNGGNMYNEVDGTTPTSNRPLRGGKANNWDGGVRVPCVVVWPGVVEPGSRSDTLITSTDFYPTLLEMLDLSPAPDQSFDGVSIVPALKGNSLDRGPIFTFFPHSTRVPDTLPPSASIYEEEWKLLRLLHNNEDGSHENRLFHLGDDIGERNNLAAKNPEQVAAMARKLDQFLIDTSAVYQKPNPNYEADLSALSAIGIAPTRNCRLSEEDGKILLTATGENPHFTIRFKKPVEKGDLELVAEFTATEAGRIDFRWAEQGVKPLFYKDRLERSSKYKANQKTRIVIPFSAAHSGPSARVDFMQKSGSVRIEGITIQNQGAIQWTSRGKSAE